jgi:HTH-type transcriptional regulator/antitoxin HigA
VKKVRLKVIRTKRDYEAALAAIEDLWGSRPGTEAHDLLEVLGVLTERYEEEAFPMSDPDPVEAIRFRLEQSGLEPKDLAPVLGSRARVSEILRHKRPLSLAMIRRLHDKLKIPLESLIPAAAH